MVSCAFWGIDVIVETSKGHPIGLFRGLDNDSHVLTRLSQYEAMKKPKALEISKQFVIGKIKGQNNLLKKYGLKQNDYSVIDAVNKLEANSLEALRRPLNTIEGVCSTRYFQQIFTFLPEFLRPTKRTTFKAYDKTNNLFNLAYTVLSWKVHLALINSKLEPYLGFLHSVQFSKPSLVCDFEELYRHMIDDFIIQYSYKLKESDFILKRGNLLRK